MRQFEKRKLCNIIGKEHELVTTTRLGNEQKPGWLSRTVSQALGDPPQWMLSLPFNPPTLLFSMFHVIGPCSQSLSCFLFLLLLWVVSKAFTNCSNCNPTLEDLFASNNDSCSKQGPLICKVLENCINKIYIYVYIIWTQFFLKK